MARDWRSRLHVSFGRAVVGLGLAVLIQFTGLRSARADFTTPYAPSDFTVVNSAFANGSMKSPDNGRSLVLTGPNDGSGLSGHTDATLICRGSGVIRFKYSYASGDDAGYDGAGYLLKGQYYLFANADKASGQVSVTVAAGDVFGFRVESADNTGEAGVLTVTEFSFPPSLSITTLSSSPNPAVLGQTVILTANVTSAVGQPGGSVVFKDGSATLGSQLLNTAGQATLAISAFAVGDHVLSAVYAGDSSFATSSSPPQTLTVRPGPTLTSVSSSIRPSVFGQPVTLTATVAAVAPATGVPTGSVAFSDGGASLGTAVLNGAGTATLTLASLTVGAHTFTATYVSDGRYAGSVSGGLAQTVNPAATTTAVTSSADTITKGQSVTFTATVSVVAPGAGTPTGAVTFKDGALTLGSASLGANLRASFTTASLSTGGRAITAVYSGDGNFNGSTSAALSETVNRAPTTTTLGPVGGPVTAGTCITLSATVTSAAGSPTGSVVFRAANSVSVAMLSGSGVATATSVCLNAGSYVITAEYSGDVNFLGSTSPGSPFNVDLIPTNISAPVLRSGTPLPGQDLTLEARVTGEGRLNGTVRFYDSYTSLGGAPIDTQGVAVLTGRFTVGLHLVTAYYEGDVLHAPARSGPLFLTIRGLSVVEISSSPNPSGPGAEVVFSAKVSGPPELTSAATGSVTFSEGAASLGTAVLNAGYASIRTTSLSPGDHTIVAVYEGDSSYAGTTSKPLTQRVVRGATTTALSGQIDGEGYLLIAKVACSSAATGSVQFEDVERNSVVGSAALANESASLRLAAPIPVGQQIRASYAGDARCDTSRSAVLPIVALANAFSFDSAGFAGNEIVSIFGRNLAQTTRSAPGAPLPQDLEGVSVEIVDAADHIHPAELYFVSANQINFVLPGTVAPGSARAVIRNASGTTAVSFVVSSVAPALASLNGSGSGTAAGYLLRVHADGSQDPPIVASGVPVEFGEPEDRLYVILYGTGFRNAQGPPECRLNGSPAPVLYAGSHATYPGLDQINLEAPATLRGAGLISASCTVEGQTTNRVSINLK